MKFVFTGYQKDNGICDGDAIRSWEDGSDSNYGMPNDLQNCMKECNLRVECAGFTYRVSDKACFWKGGSRRNAIWKIGRFCYRKPKGTSKYVEYHLLSLDL